MLGKIINLSGYYGTIEYDIDKTIAFRINSSDYRIGDLVEFRILKSKNDISNNKSPEAEITEILEKYKKDKDGYIRLSKVAKHFTLGISNIVDVLAKRGFKIQPNPNTYISESQFQVINNYFNKNRKSRSKNYTEIYERGTVIETQIKKIITPSLIILYFSPNKDAYLYLKNLDWNLVNAAEKLKSLKENDNIKVVILENTSNKVTVSRKHIIPRYSESAEWNRLSIGEKINGKICEKLINKLVVKTDSGLFGILASQKEQINQYKLNESYTFILQGKNESLQLLDLSTKKGKKEIGRPYALDEDFNLLEPELLTLNALKKSPYYTYASEREKEVLERLFSTEKKLFSKEIKSNQTLYISFHQNKVTWEKDFKNSLIPYLYEDTYKKSLEKKAKTYLENQRYWLRYNEWNEDRKIKNQWILFNEKIYLAGFVLINSGNFDFIITKLSIERTIKKNSFIKEKSLNKGTFLFANKIRILSPTESKPFNMDQKDIYRHIQHKTLALNILNNLKSKTGEIIRTEGKSISIFDKFLEYQEDIERKGKDKERVKIEPSQWKQIPHTISDLAIELDVDLDDLFGKEDGDNQIVTIKTEEKSHKEDKDTELVRYDDAVFESNNNKARLHIKQNDKPLELLDKGFFIERKISLKQFQVQREVIKDFFDKKLKLEHIEKLLLQPEKIEEPDEPSLDYFNHVLKNTETEQPNNNQIKAVKKAVGNKNIFLIQGPPGTGKTTIISEIAEQLINKGEKILVTSQTHIAVDNVLEKISKNKKLVCIRVGNKQRIKEDLHEYQIDNIVKSYTEDFEKLVNTNINLATIYEENKNILSREELYESLKSRIDYEYYKYSENIRDYLVHKNYDFLQILYKISLDSVKHVIETLNYWKRNIKNQREVILKPLLYKSVDAVFATCIGIRTDQELNEYDLKFDTVIVDEAGKANISESFASISMAKKVILVGDQMQLPPYVDGNLLDKENDDSFPNSKYGNSFKQEDIEHSLKTSFFEFLVNRIKNNQFPETNKELLNYQHRMHPHIGEFISEAFYDGMVKMGEGTHKNVLRLNTPFDKEVIFINTSTYKDPYESFDGFSAKNDSEAICISSLIVPRLMEAGLNSNDFAIVAPYKSQVSNIKKYLKDENTSDIDVSTLDSFQGMEFEVIVFSFTRAASPEQKNRKVGFLDDARRLNVALSRAKKKLILVGNSKTLRDTRSHFDVLFNYTKLFKNLINLSKKESIGNFVDITNFMNLETPFERFSKNNEVGAIVNGRIKRLEDYGAFVDLGLVDGLIHIKDLSWNKIKHPREIVSLDQEINVKILSYDSSNEYVSLGLKQIYPDPWDKLIKGKTHMGKIKEKTNYGIFVEIFDGIKGLLHKSNLPRSNCYKVGMEIEVKVNTIDKKRRRISLKLARE